MFKSRLQELCHQKLWSLPNYSSSKDGPDHNPRFKASVSVNGVSFDTISFCNSSKDAHNEAAKLAFIHFTSPQPLFLPNDGPTRDSSPHSSSGSSSASTELNNSPNTRGAMFPKTQETYESQIPGNALSVKDDKEFGGSSSASTELNNTSNGRGALLPKFQETYQSPQIHGNALGFKDDRELGDMEYLYKNQLQNYVQRRNLSSPLYSCEHEGQSHALRFKAKVTVDGKTFESPKFFHTLKEAEHASAKAALMSLSLDGIQEDDSGLYKNLLQELAVKEGFCLPIYKTIRSGASHLPTFFSTVEIEGDIFNGKVAKTKKQAEMNAAKVAYYGLKERRLSRSPEFLFPDCQAKEALECTSPSSHLTVTVDLQQNLKPRAEESTGPLVSTPGIRSKEHAEESRDVDQERIVRRSEEHAEDTRDEDQEADSAEVISVNANASTQHFIPSPPKPDFNMMTRNRESSSSTDMVYARLRDPFPSLSSPTKPSECSTVVSKMEVPTEMGSFLLCNRVRVYPRKPDMAFPKGITLLPISDDKWVAVSLDFPNQEDN